MIIPSTIDGKCVLGIDNTYVVNLKSVELEEGILYFNGIKGKNIETIILPKSLKSIGNVIEGCYSLKTIKYAGKKAEWEALVKNNDPNDWYVEEERDYENNKTTYKYITFKVECSDETITYSHE